jgi:hypothetical protein
VAGKSAVDSDRWSCILGAELAGILLFRTGWAVSFRLVDDNRE